MTATPSPYSMPFDLAQLSERVVELRVAPTAAERAAIASWLGIVALDRFDADLQLFREGNDRYGYAAMFSADVVQECIVTLQPVPAHLTGEFNRHFHVVAPLASHRRKAAAEDAVTDVPGPDDETEVLSGHLLDVASPLLEELSLALDPYPRAKGVVFETPEEQKGVIESPFAVLRQLREGPGSASGNDKPAPVKAKARAKRES